MSSLIKNRFDDFTESIAAFAVVSLMSFTYNIGIGITAGLCFIPSAKWFEDKPAR